MVVGDVAGHGVQSAVVMGRIRSALRAYALLDTSPAHVLDLVERKVEQFEIGTYVTIVCAVSSPPYDALTIAVAGHPPPVVATPGRTPTYPKLEISTPIGARPQQARRSTTVLSPPKPSSCSTRTASSSGAARSSTSASHASEMR